jgi:hypothetical protein
MANDSGVPPLPRRVPGAADSPRPRAKAGSPPLPDPVRQRLLSALANETERTPGLRAAPERDAPEARAPGREARPKRGWAASFRLG